MGGTLIQHIPDAVPERRWRTSSPIRVDQPGHEVAVVPGTLLHRIAGTSAMRVNSAHHQAVADPGPTAIVDAVAPDGVIEGIEDPGRAFCLGVQWHPEFHIDPADRRIFDALVAACAA